MNDKSSWSRRLLNAFKLVDWATTYCVFATILWSMLGLWILGMSRAGTDYDFLNKLGGYLGGFFSPIAIFWLVRGFYLQRAQAKESAAILEKNTDSLLQQVEALQRMVAAVEARESRAIDPVFRVYWEECRAEKGMFHVTIDNMGHDVSDFSFYAVARKSIDNGQFRDGESLDSGYVHWLPRGTVLRTGIAMSKGRAFPMRIRLAYVRVDGVNGQRLFERLVPDMAGSFHRIDLR